MLGTLQNNGKLTTCHFCMANLYNWILANHMNIPSASMDYPDNWSAFSKIVWNHDNHALINK